MARHRHIWQGENLMHTYRLHCDCGWAVTVTNRAAPQMGIADGADPSEVQEVLSSVVRQNRQHPILPGRVLRLAEDRPVSR